MDGEQQTDDCEKCGGQASEPAFCPYDLDINGVEKLCNCCDGCRQQCADDI